MTMPLETQFWRPLRPARRPVRAQVVAVDAGRAAYRGEDAPGNGADEL